MIILFLSLFFSMNSFATSSGEEIFNNKCISCHGEAGSALVTPIIFGQEPAYIIHSLQSFKNGERTDHLMGVMNGIASGLTDDEMKSLAKYVAGEDACRIAVQIDTTRPDFEKEFLAGQVKVNEKNCMHCHANLHHLAPRINGQKSDYLKNQLEAFRSKTRVWGMMNKIAGTLSDEDIKNIVTYINGLRIWRSCEDGGNGHEHLVR